MARRVEKYREMNTNELEIQADASFPSRFSVCVFSFRPGRRKA